MTNRSNRHIKVNNNHTMGVLRSCEEDQICTIQKIVTFEQKPKKGKEEKSESKPVEENLYHIPTRNVKTETTEVNTLLEKDFFPVTNTNEVGPQQDFVHYKKPELQDVPTDRQIKLELEKLLRENSDSFAEDERQIGTTPLIKMSIDTGD